MNVSTKKKEVKEKPKVSGNKEKMDEIERKMEALFQGMVEMREDLDKIKERMGL